MRWAKRSPTAPESRDIRNKAFWDKLHGIFAATLEMVREKAQEMGIDLDAIDFAKQEKQVRKRAKEQPYSKAAMKYIRMVDAWFNSNKDLLEDQSDELQTLAQTDIPGTSPADEA